MVKVVYAILAVLMGLSLFLVTGAVNVGTIFGGSSSGESAVTSFEEQAENDRSEAGQNPDDEDMLANLTRTRINAANAMITNGAGESQSGVEEVKQQFALASEDWSEYLAAAGEPSPGLAIQVAPALFQLAELARAAPGSQGKHARRRPKPRKSSPKARPSLNSLEHARLLPALHPGLQRRRRSQ